LFIPGRAAGILKPPSDALKGTRKTVYVWSPAIVAADVKAKEVCPATLAS
jgi:hypothetical protein